MKRFMGLALVLFGAGLALVLYAVLFGPRDFKKSLTDKQVPVNQIQYNGYSAGSPQQNTLDTKSGATMPAASQPEAHDAHH